MDSTSLIGFRRGSETSPGDLDRTGRGNSESGAPASGRIAADLPVGAKPLPAGAKPLPADPKSLPADPKSLPADPKSGSPSFLSFYAPVAEPMASVETRLRRELQSRYESITPLLQHGTQLGGKRLRPALVLLSGAAVGPIGDDHVVLGTVVEMVHTATLVHDDVLDGATTRRHHPTVNAAWSEDVSILLGDYLFAQSFRLAATLDSTEACRWIGEAARRVCEGELRQLLHRDVIGLDEATYFEMIRGKTAELCQVACRLGARHSGGDDATLAAVATYGDALGIAFQIADDLLDLWGDRGSVGKTLGTDLQQGKMTLPIIRLLETSDAAGRREIARIMAGPPEQRWTRLRSRFAESDAADYTRRVAVGYRDKALAAVGGLPDTPARNSLIALAELAITRDV